MKGKETSKNNKKGKGTTNKNQLNSEFLLLLTAGLCCYVFFLFCFVFSFCIFFFFFVERFSLLRFSSRPLVTTLVFLHQNQDAPAAIDNHLSRPHNHPFPSLDRNNRRIFRFQSNCGASQRYFSCL
jgi:hypothetical protein